jgi:hypothetical protein
MSVLFLLWAGRVYLRGLAVQADRFAVSERTSVKN